MHDAEVILVGDELLKGERSDAHLAYLGRALARYGVRVARARVVGDTAEVIAEGVREGIGRARVLIVTGGLGPTPDDVTRDGVAAALGRALEFHEGSWSHIVAFFARYGREATENNRRQAYFPAGAEVLGNDGGTAPGFAVEERGTTTFVLPGPPHELQRMFEHDVAPRLASIFAREPLRVETLRTIGVGESQLVVWFGEMLDGLRWFAVSSLPWVSGVDVVLTAREGGLPEDLDEEAGRVVSAFVSRLGSKFYERGERSLAQVTGELLAARKETLAVAESLTGGLVAELLTDVPGSSRYFLAGATTYSNESKSAWAGVDPRTVGRVGAVSEEVCAEMAEGVRSRMGATWGLSTTGIAGPTGATPDKPLGLTYLGVAGPGGGRVVRKEYRGTREQVRRRAAHGVLWVLYDRLAGGSEVS